MFSYSATGTYAQSVSLTGDSSASASTGFDSPASIPDKQIENGLAVPKNYKGVNGGSGYVVAGGADKEVNGYEYAGLINKKYAANYRIEYKKGNADYWLNKLAAAHNVTIDDQDNGGTNCSELRRSPFSSITMRKRPTDISAPRRRFLRVPMPPFR